MPGCTAVLLFLAAVLGGSAHPRVPRFHPRNKHHPAASPLFSTPVNLNKDLVKQCTEKYRGTILDHFTWQAGEQGSATFNQRYFVCDRNWRPDDNGNPGPIFFYLGNEADVTLYLNASGLMWENAEPFGAMLVFAEHRYYGRSLPFNGKDIRKHMQYLSAEQAMADYAELIWELKQQYNASNAPVIGFGGSYGGMLASWMRMKYPHVLAGAIAGSAPIWAFEGEDPPMDPAFFARGVTHDATPAGGAPQPCATNVRAGWKLLQTLGDSNEGRARIRQAMSLCQGAKLSSPDDVLALRDWLASAWDYMAMGNFPYKSSYILNGHGELPPFPVVAACKQGLQRTDLQEDELLAAMAQAAGVYYNFSGSVTCFDFSAGANPESDEDADFWGYQYCTEMFMPFAKDGVRDMFWEEPWDGDAAAEGCKQAWGVTPRRLWATIEWGGKAIGAASNIAFSNGLLDPWHGGGVLRDISDSLPAIIIPEGAHHLDLMFSHPDDPQSVIAARKAQRELMQQWIKQARHTLPSLPKLDDKPSPQGQRQQQASVQAGGVQIQNQSRSSHHAAAAAAVASSVRRMLRHALE